MVLFIFSDFFNLYILPRLHLPRELLGMQQVTFGSSDVYEAEERFEIIKRILIREELLTRIALAVRAEGGREVAGASDVVYSTLSELQRITVEVVEAVQNWRTRYTKRDRTPFVWSGTNYLVRIASSLNFLDDIASLRARLGFGTRANPFLVIAADPTTRQLRAKKEGRARRRQSVPTELFGISGISMERIGECQLVVEREQERVGPATSSSRATALGGSSRGRGRGRGRGRRGRGGRGRSRGRGRGAKQRSAARGGAGDDAASTGGGSATSGASHGHARGKTPTSCDYCGRDSAAEDALACQDRGCGKRYCSPCGAVNLGAAEVHKLLALIKGWQCWVCGTKQARLQQGEADRTRERKEAKRAKRDALAAKKAAREKHEREQLAQPQGAAGLLRWMQGEKEKASSSGSVAVAPGAGEGKDPTPPAAAAAAAAAVAVVKPKRKRSEALQIRLAAIASKKEKAKAEAEGVAVAAAEADGEVAPATAALKGAVTRPSSRGTTEGSWATPASSSASDGSSAAGTQVPAAEATVPAAAPAAAAAAASAAAIGEKPKAVGESATAAAAAKSDSAEEGAPVTAVAEPVSTPAALRVAAPVEAAVETAVVAPVETPAAAVVEISSDTEEESDDEESDEAAALSPTSWRATHKKLVLQS